MKKLKGLLSLAIASLMLIGISFSSATNNVQAQDTPPGEEEPQTCGICVNENSENSLFVSDFSDFEAENCPCEE